MAAELIIELNELNTINQKISELTRQRNNLLRELRGKCRHLRLVELDDSPPKRICADCGAEEEGWHCGYQVLVMDGDTWNAPHKKERVLVRRTSDWRKFAEYRKNSPLYHVGQSHPNFERCGPKSYEQLTEVR